MIKGILIGSNTNEKEKLLLNSKNIFISNKLLTELDITIPQKNIDNYAKIEIISDEEYYVLIYKQWASKIKLSSNFCEIKPVVNDLEYYKGRYYRIDHLLDCRITIFKLIKLHFSYVYNTEELFPELFSNGNAIDTKNADVIGTFDTCSSRNIVNESSNSTNIYYCKTEEEVPEFNQKNITSNKLNCNKGFDEKFLSYSTKTLKINVIKNEEESN